MFCDVAEVAVANTHFVGEDNWLPAFESCTFVATSLLIVLGALDMRTFTIFPKLALVARTSACVLGVLGGVHIILDYLG